MISIQQLTLPLSWPDNFSFKNFVAGNNANLINHLKSVAAGQGERFIYFWGLQGVGKSHLLSACSQTASEKGLQIFYLPLLQLKNLSPKIIENLEMYDLICVDDLQAIAGNKQWEEAVFHLYNRSQSSNRRLIISGNVTVSELSLQLPDLTSRLLSGIIFQLDELSEPDKLKVLQQHAEQRGLHLSVEVGQFLLRHLPRDLASLLDNLNQLDKASLSSQRKLTIPFVKEVLTVFLSGGT